MTILSYNIYRGNTIRSNYPNRITLYLRVILLKKLNNKHFFSIIHLFIYIGNKI